LAANALFCSGVLNSPMNEAHFTKALCSKLYALFDEEDFTHNSLSSLLCISRVPQKRVSSSTSSCLCRCHCTIKSSTSFSVPRPLKGRFIHQNKLSPQIQKNCVSFGYCASRPRNMALIGFSQVAFNRRKLQCISKDFTVSLHISKLSSNGSKSHFVACL
jgi:hypothetical protein